MAVVRDNIDVALSELETSIDRLRALYEQYFMGVERIEPTIARKAVEKRIADLRKKKFRNTAKRFKFQTITQRYTTMQQYWSRTCREIENGTYRKHKLRAEQKLGSVDELKREQLGEIPRQHDGISSRAKASAESDLTNLLDENIDLEAEMQNALADAEKLTAATSSPSPESLANLAQPSNPRPTASGRGGGLLAKLGKRDTGAPSSQAKSSALTKNISPQGPDSLGVKSRPPKAPRADAKKRVQPESKEASLTQQRIQALHQAYSKARRDTKARDVSYEKLERKIRETEKALRAKHAGKSVDFDVVVKNGKAILKPKLGS
ncbi:MAG: hypothetical protein MK135_06030 [Polyangiaceae bacterium]|nr:hypothetical protein [Polyangiaceae bacterium]